MLTMNVTIAAETPEELRMWLTALGGPAPVAYEWHTSRLEPLRPEASDEQGEPASEPQTLAEQDTEADDLAVGDDISEEEMQSDPKPQRRFRRTKAQIEADAKAAVERTLAAAAIAGVIPNQQDEPPAEVRSDTDQSVLHDQGPAKTEVKPPVAVPPLPPVAVPPTAATVPPPKVTSAVPPITVPMAQVPSMPDVPAMPEINRIPTNVLEMRDILRQINMAPNCRGITHRIMKKHLWFTPESIPVDQYESFLDECHAEAMGMDAA